MSDDATKHFRPLSELNLMDNFLFHAMLMQEDVGEEFCKILLKTILGKEIKRVRITPQKEIPGIDTNLHGVRLDAYIEDVSDCDALNADIIPDIYDVEPNKIYEKETLPRRMRYYHSMIDAQVLSTGVNYEKLPNVVTIFILPYDPFRKNRMVYTFRNQCMEDADVNYEDGALNIILYTRGSEGTPSQELKDMLHYMEKTTADNITNRELGDVHRLVDRVKTRKEVDLSYMKSWEWDAYNRKVGREEGREEGIRALITSCRNLNVSREDVLKQLAQNLSLDEATAMDYLDKYYQQ